MFTTRTRPRRTASSDHRTDPVPAPVVDAPDPAVLADFYAQLLGWEVAEREPDWVRITPGRDEPGLSFRHDVGYAPPVWATPAGPRQTLVDIAVADLDTAEDWAVSCGATVAGFQPHDDVRIMIDPAGHPFDLFRDHAA